MKRIKLQIAFLLLAPHIAFAMESSSRRWLPDLIESFKRSIQNGEIDFGIIPNSLLHAAFAGDSTTIAKLIALGTDLEQKDKAGWTPLHWAAAQGDRASVFKLIEATANINAQSKNKETPLILAIKSEEREIAWILLGAKADPNKTDAGGWSALTWAAYMGDDALVRKLVHNGANPYLIDKAGYPIWTRAKEQGHEEICDLLDGCLHSSPHVIINDVSYNPYSFKESLYLTVYNTLEFDQPLSDTILLAFNPRFRDYPMRWASSNKCNRVLSIALDGTIRKNMNAHEQEVLAGEILTYERTLIALAAYLGADLNDEKTYSAMVKCLHNNDYQLARYLIKKGYVIRAKGSCNDIDQLRHCKTIELARLFVQHTPHLYLDPDQFYIAGTDDYQPELFKFYVELGLDLHYWLYDNFHKERGYLTSNLLELLKLVTYKSDKMPSEQVVKKACILIQAGTDLFLRYHQYGETALHFAAQFKNKKLCQAIVNQFMERHKGWLQFLAYLRSHENIACRLLYASKPLLATYFKESASNQKLLIKLLGMTDPSYKKAWEYYRCKGLNPHTYTFKSLKEAELNEDELWREEPEIKVAQVREPNAKKSEGCICL